MSTPEDKENQLPLQASSNQPGKSDKSDGPDTIGHNRAESVKVGQPADRQRSAI